MPGEDAAVGGGVSAQFGAEQQPGDATITPETVRQHLSAILRSRTFAQAPMLCRLLEYLVDRSLDGRAADLKEYSIGVEAFDRGASFDPRTDTIVRVQARRLRSKLTDYYRDEGLADAIKLTLPKGHYAVAYRRQESASSFETSADGPSIVVLPFANLSRDEDNEYFSDGLTEELISGLAGIAELRVVARTSAFQFKGRGIDIREVGRVLGVRTALEGSVRKQGERIRVAVQLIDTADGLHLWSQVFNRELVGVFEIQEEITRATVAALRIRLMAASVKRRPSSETALPRVYELFLQGRYFHHRATIADVKKSVDCFTRAIALDPQYAPAHAALADAYIFWATLASEKGPKDLLHKARHAAQAALALDQSSAEGLCSLGSVLLVGDWDFGGAERELLRALEAKPSFVYARLCYAMALLAMRRPDEAVMHARTALSTDPLSVFSRTILGQALVLAGRPDSAIDELRQALALEPGFVFGRYTLALACLAKASYQEAVDVLTEGSGDAREYGNYAGHLGYAYARIGRRADAEQVVRDLLSRAWVPAIDVAAIYNALDQTSSALQWLEHARRERHFDSLYIWEDPRFRNLHSHPGFIRLHPPVTTDATAPGV